METRGAARRGLAAETYGATTGAAAPPARVSVVRMRGPGAILVAGRGGDSILRGERGGKGGSGSVRVLGSESLREEAVEEEVAAVAVVVAVAEEAGTNQLRAETWPTSRCSESSGSSRRC